MAVQMNFSLIESGSGLEVKKNLSPIVEQDQRIASLREKAMELISYVRSLSLKTIHNVISVKEGVNLEVAQFSTFYEKYQLDYLYFCEINLELSKRRVSMALEASKKNLRDEIAVNNAIAISFQLAGPIEVCSVVVMQARRMNLYPVIISLTDDSKFSSEMSNHEVVILFDQPQQVDAFSHLCKRMGNNFYCVVKQLKEAIVVDPYLCFTIPSKELELHTEYKSYISSLKATKIFKKHFVIAPFEELQKTLDELLQNIEEVKKQNAIFFQPGARCVRQKWVELIQQKLETAFLPFPTQWQPDSGFFSLSCMENGEAAVAIRKKLTAMEIQFISIPFEGNEKLCEFSIDCFEIIECRELYEKLKGRIGLACTDDLPVEEV